MKYIIYFYVEIFLEIIVLSKSIFNILTTKNVSISMLVITMIHYAVLFKSLKIRAHIFFIRLIEGYNSTSYVPEQKCIKLLFSVQIALLLRHQYSRYPLKISNLK